MAIAKFVEWCRSKTKVAQLEKDVIRHGELLDRDNKRISAVEAEIKSVNNDLKDMHILMRLNTKAQQAIMKNLLDGDNKGSIQEVSMEIQEYLNAKI